MWLSKGDEKGIIETESEYRRLRMTKMKIMKMKTIIKVRRRVKKIVIHENGKSQVDGISNYMQELGQQEKIEKGRGRCI